MKEYRSADGERRLWFDENEIDLIVENELRNAGLFPIASDPVTEIEEFLELHLQVRLELYAPLDLEFLGATYFERGHKPYVQINKNLTMQAEASDATVGLVGRWRATLAHEAAHVILHRRFFEQPPEQTEFSFHGNGGVGPTLMKCLKRNITFRRASVDWKEFQANQGMAALLMPASLFSEVTRRMVGAKCTEDLLPYIPSSDSRDYWGLLRELSCCFGVSQEAARIRLDTIGLRRFSIEPMLGGMH